MKEKISLERCDCGQCDLYKLEFIDNGAKKKNIIIYLSKEDMAKLEWKFFCVRNDNYNWRIGG